MGPSAAQVLLSTFPSWCHHVHVVFLLPLCLIFPASFRASSFLPDLWTWVLPQVSLWDCFVFMLPGCPFLPNGFSLNQQHPYPYVQSRSLSPDCYPWTQMSVSHLYWGGPEATKPQHAQNWLAMVPLPHAKPPSGWHRLLFVVPLLEVRISPMSSLPKSCWFYALIDFMVRLFFVHISVFGQCQSFECLSI